MGSFRSISFVLVSLCIHDVYNLETKPEAEAGESSGLHHLGNFNGREYYYEPDNTPTSPYYNAVRKCAAYGMSLPYFYSPHELHYVKSILRFQGQWYYTASTSGHNCLLMHSNVERLTEYPCAVTAYVICQRYDYGSRILPTNSTVI